MGKPDPRFPLLGLSALIENDLRVMVDGESSRFRIGKSLRSNLRDVYRKYFASVPTFHK